MSVDPALSHHAALDARLVAAVRPIRMLEAVSWPAQVQESFLAAWRAGNISMPHIAYPRFDFHDVRSELDAIHRAADADHPLGHYLQQTSESWRIATRLLDVLGSHRVTAYSTRLFGRPVEMLPANGPTNLEAATHFVDLANELDQELRNAEPSYVLPAEQVQLELQQAIDTFFVGHQIRVELDPNLIAKAAASPTRIRLRTNTGFSEYDRNQLLMHEAFVHTLTGLNGREQPWLKSMARGAPRTTATQEGLATLSEMLSGAMDIGRMKRIS
ncbi:MAG: flavohemoglobin expression-modulating QEGLA motif protein, partial [Gammaproteobacteria bacterium HGW-Gammaproteobacteria-5]